MRERTRYRVSGSLFLIALAVILLPMLFDSPGSPNTQVPVQPAVTAPPVNAPDYDDTAPATDVVERVQTLQSEVDEGGFTTDSGTRFGEPELRTDSATASVLAVQAASFTSRDNAIAFRTRLREAGFEAFISTAKRETAQVHRVAIGPLLARVDAEQIQREVAEQFHLEPQIVEMLP
jgi:cell division septation protein DedD